MARGRFEKNALNVKMLAGLLLRLSRQDLEKRLEAAKIRISPLGLGVLSSICKNNCTISELSRKMFIAPATLVPVIDALEKDSLVARKSDSKDRRKNPLALTPKGKAVVSKIPFVDKNDSIVSGLSKIGERKTEELVLLLSELVDLLSNEKGISRKIISVLDSNKKTKACFVQENAKKAKRQKK